MNLSDRDKTTDTKPHDKLFHDGPCRETATTMLSRAVEFQKRKLAGLEHLLKIAVKLETGSPVEDALWELLCHNHNYLNR